MKKIASLIRTLIFAALALPLSIHAALVGEWNFDNAGNLAEASIGNELLPVGVIDAAPAGITAGDGAAAVDIGEHFGVDHSIGANGGGTLTNEYAILFDISYPTTSVGNWMSFYQTDDSNSNDGDLFISNNAAVGVGDLSYSANVTVPETWYRVILSHDLGDGTSHVYVDGQEWVAGGSQGLDGRFSIFFDRSPDFLLFADENGEDATIHVSHVGLFDTPIDAAGAAALGEAGDPLVAPTKFCPAGLTCSISGDPIEVTLGWKAPVGLDSTGIEILRDGGLIATIPPGSDSYVDAPPPPGGSQFVDFEYTLRMVGGEDSVDCLPLTCTATVYTGALEDDLVLHLALDGNPSDSSGRANDGTISGTPTFAPGQISDAIALTDPADPHQYIDLGTPADLEFGTDVDFSVSVWVNNASGFPDNTGAGGSNDDPAIVSNKDWNAGGNIGWVISAGGNGRWQWNIGDGTGRADYDGPANQIDDGQWHHLLVSHDRDGQALLFYDGQQVSTQDISGIGDISSGLSTAVGTDGLFGGVWANWFPGMIDDVLIWRRLVTQPEAETVYQNGLDSKTFGQVPLLITAINYDMAAHEISVTFNSQNGRTYAVDTSDDFVEWDEVDDGVESEGASTTYTVTGIPADTRRLFVRVRALE